MIWDLNQERRIYYDKNVNRKRSQIWHNQVNLEMGHVKSQKNRTEAMYECE